MIATISESVVCVVCFCYVWCSLIKAVRSREPQPGAGNQLPPPGGGTLAHTHLRSDFPGAARDELALHAFLQGLSPPRLGQHVRLILPPTLDVVLYVAERAEPEISDQPSLQLSTEADCQDQSGPAKHCCRRWGARVDAAGPQYVFVVLKNIEADLNLVLKFKVENSEYSLSHFGQFEVFQVRTGGAFCLFLCIIERLCGGSPGVCADGVPSVATAAATADAVARPGTITFFSGRLIAPEISDNIAVFQLI